MAMAVAALLLAATLAALQPAAATRQYSLTVLESLVSDTQWVGDTDQVVFTITQGGHLWRSMDGGMTWSDHTSNGKLEGVFDTPPGDYGDYVPQKGVQALLFHEAAANKIFFRGGGEFHWITDDFGESYKKVQGPAGHLGLIAVRFHPTETDWMLVIARRWSCWSQDRLMRRACADDLFLTKDFGKNWMNLTERAKGRILSFADFDWGWSKDPEAPQNKVYKKETILAAVYEDREDVRKHLELHGTHIAAGWDQYVDFIRSHNLFKTAHTKVVPCGNQFEIMNGKLFLAVAQHCGEVASINSPESGVKLAISSDQGATFTEACFPVALSERGYSVVDASPSAVHVNVDYALGQRSAPFGDVFVSDANLTLFTVSLTRNSRSRGGAVDFAAVQGLPGVYIANQVEVDEDDGVTARHAGSAQVGTSEDDLLARTASKISLNGGATWETLRPPAKDSAGADIPCDAAEGCSLHLHGTTSWASGSGFAFVYSHKTIPGLVISTGNVGQFLYQDSTVNTYLSRDGGQVWEEMRKGAHIYEFGDSGGVIVMARHSTQGTTNQLLYSLDEGLKWETLTFAREDEAIDISNIRVEPDNVGKKFIIQGTKATDPEGAARQGVLLAVNFGEGFAEYKVCGPNDYEWWSPSQKHCLLGRNLTYQRQFRSSKCWNGDKYEPPSKVTPCACTAADYQCDFGMEPVRDRCEPVPGFEPRTCPVLAAGAYAYSASKQRLAAGDVCLNPTPLLGHYTEPHYTHPLRSWTASVLLGVLLVLAAGAVLLGLAYTGHIPDEWLQHIPFLERLRYLKLRSNFQSLADDFGGDDESEAREMYGRA